MKTIKKISIGVICTIAIPLMSLIFLKIDSIAAAPPFAIIYNANGGKGAPPTYYYMPGSYSVSTTKPTRSDFVFKGWSTNKNATTASYQPGDRITVSSSNITLYAVWSCISHNWNTTDVATCTTTGYRVCLRCKIPDTIPALGHSHKNNVCIRVASCGHINRTNSNQFQYYMYRKGKHARKISCGWLGYSGHYAIDITNGSGDPIKGFEIYAQGPGTVIYTNPSISATAGWYIVIRYDNGYTARYLHMQDKSPLAKDSRVSNKTIIGKTGNTGASTGPHLHFDVNDRNDYGGMSSKHLNPTTLFPSGTFS